MKTVIERLEWLGGHDNVRIEHGCYIDGTTAFNLWVTAPEGYEEVLATPSTNLTAYDIEPLMGAFFIKDYSEHVGLGDALVAAGVVYPTGRTVEFGPWDSHATEYFFTPAYWPVVVL